MRNSDSQRIESLTYKVHEHQLEQAWKRFENAGFKPVLIKGWAAAQLYPVPAERRFNDIDLIIEKGVYAAAVQFAAAAGDKTAIDLHCEAKTLDTLSYAELYNRTNLVRCGATDIRVLCAEDHLRVLCVHWLVDGGAKKEKLWDIYYGVANRPANFDWNRCLNAAGSTRRRWIVCAIGLAHKYLGLNLEDTPLADEAASIPPWVIEALENEWRVNIPVVPLASSLRDRRELWRQIKKRIVPNPIQATVDMEGEFDNRPRLFYQIGDIFWRLGLLLKRILKSG